MFLTSGDWKRNRRERWRRCSVGTKKRWALWITEELAVTPQRLTQYLSKLQQM